MESGIPWQTILEPFFVFPQTCHYCDFEHYSVERVIVYKVELKCQDIPLHTVETKSVLMIKRCINFLVNKSSALRGQYVHIPMHLTHCLHHSVRQHVRPKSSIVDWGAEEKAINIFAARSIRAYSPKHFSVLSTHLLPETPPLRDKKQSNQSNNESIRQSISQSLN